MDTPDVATYAHQRVVVDAPDREAEEMVGVTGKRVASVDAADIISDIVRDFATFGKTSLVVV